MPYPERKVIARRMPAGKPAPQALAVPTGVKLAGGLLIGAGVAIGITGLQVMLFIVLQGAYLLVGPLAMILSGGCVFFGGGTVLGHLPAAKLALALSAATTLFACAWIVLAFFKGTIVFSTLAVVPLSSVAYVVLRREMPELERLDQARERQRAEGPKS